MFRESIGLAMVALFSFSVDATAQGNGMPSGEKADHAEAWHNLDFSSNGVMGVSTERTYRELLAGMESKTVLVAVIDSGIDIDHEDLKGRVWTNAGEIPGNGKDDDGNGYVDDIHGWNFLGVSDGRNVYKARLELTRLKSQDQGGKKVQKAYKKKLEEAEKEFSEIKLFKKRFDILYGIAEKVMEKEEFTADELREKMKSISQETEQGVQVWAAMGFVAEILERSDRKELENYIGRLEKEMKVHLNPDYNERELVMGDDVADFSEKYYGNNDVSGDKSSEEHGTHVAGIIAARRDNDLGVKGVADNVRIMALRVVPNGDEQDKDVANAIRYAVDNGAQVINMSFGKKYSPYKSQVDEAVRYADVKGVLIVNAAGNDSENVDKQKYFPSAEYSGKGEAENWIDIGASTKYSDSRLVAEFSNYGKKTVDVFAPGSGIKSLLPNNKYGERSGTSMAAPVVTGIAATLMSYFPELTAKEVKDIILESAVPFSGAVLRPNTKQKVKTSKLNKLCGTGGVVDLYQAVSRAKDFMASKDS
ncbi:peptidase S8 [Fulvitalea axinellae]|uniref:Peptidase S8 n=1 Tax=Fulvitalea axinellae TaxID=1182444 RepID=A0AAU9DD55_9BACT|nr:peptidase S8 [Fulvitalea axinellae]